ncbi:undecaprenyl-phosphate galactose phosphotransferase WbaP [Radicibacter daui]|uniref:undecaprenyl-phosphate galactose phosphotransferase WbaP n=1 Tax=Radicibacter daui TaxID=3064829 RepID=UPI004046FA45
MITEENKFFEGFSCGSKYGIIFVNLIRRIAMIFSDVLGLVIPFFVIRKNFIDASLYIYKMQENGTASRVDTGVDWYFILISVALVLMIILGFYGERKSLWDEIYVYVRAFFFMILFDFVVLFTAGYSGGGVYFFSFWVFAFVFVLFIRAMFKAVLNRLGLWSIATVVVGSETNIEHAVEAVSKQATVGYAIRDVLVLTDRGSLQGSLAVAGYNSTSASDVGDIINYIERRPDVHVVLASDERFSDAFYKITDFLASRPNTLDLLPSIKGLPLYGTDIIHLFGEEILMLRVRNNLSRRVPKLFKRVMDVFISLIMILILAPVFLFLALLIKSEDGGSPIYVQTRVGRNGRLFNCYKFRSMKVDAEQVLSRWQGENPALFAEYKAGNFKLRNDPRITRIGRFIRAHSLDELPQLFNVLLGQMALIGPRPLIEREVPDYGGRIIHYYRTRPGITGLWQVSGRSETTFVDRAAYDEWYVKNWSVWLDVVILIKTVRVVLGRGGAY